MSPGDSMGWCDTHDRRETLRFDADSRPYGTGYCSRMNEASYIRKIRQGKDLEVCRIVTFVRETALSPYQKGWEDRTQAFVRDEIAAFSKRLRDIGAVVDVNVV